MNEKSKTVEIKFSTSPIETGKFIARSGGQGKHNHMLEALFAALQGALSAKDKASKGASVMLPCVGLKPYHAASLEKKFDKIGVLGIEVALGTTETGEPAVRVLRTIAAEDSSKRIENAKNKAGLTGK